MGEFERLEGLHKARQINVAGHSARREGEIETTRTEWESARRLAPKLEEIPFWQVIALVDDGEDVQWAVEIFSSMLLSNDRVNDWIDLIFILEACGLLSTKGSVQKLVDAIGTS